jgi:hypothetical protein
LRPDQAEIPQVKRLISNSYTTLQTDQVCCQTNTNQYQFSSSLNLLGCAETAPLGQSDGTVQLEIRSVVEMALRVEMVMDLGVDGDEFL